MGDRAINQCCRPEALGRQLLTGFAYDLDILIPTPMATLAIRWLSSTVLSGSQARLFMCSREFAMLEAITQVGQTFSLTSDTTRYRSPSKPSGPRGSRASLPLQDDLE